MVRQLAQERVVQERGPGHAGGDGGHLGDGPHNYQDLTGSESSGYAFLPRAVYSRHLEFAAQADRLAQLHPRCLRRASFLGCVFSPGDRPRGQQQLRDPDPPRCGVGTPHGVRRPSYRWIFRSRHCYAQQVVPQRHAHGALLPGHLDQARNSHPAAAAAALAGPLCTRTSSCGTFGRGRFAGDSWLEQRFAGQAQAHDAHWHGREHRVGHTLAARHWLRARTSPPASPLTDKGGGQISAGDGDGAAQHEGDQHFCHLEALQEQRPRRGERRYHYLDGHAFRQTCIFSDRLHHHGRGERCTAADEQAPHRGSTRLPNGPRRAPGHLLLPRRRRLRVQPQDFLQAARRTTIARRTTTPSCRRSSRRKDASASATSQK